MGEAGLIGWFERLADLVRWPVTVFERWRPSIQDRLVGAVLFAPGATVLGIAISLTADPSGMGTHQQLGLGGCAVLTMTGLPCPMCGMTTTFTHLAHFDVIQGTINQPFGLVLFSVMVALTAVGLSDLILPGQRWRRVWRWVERHETVVALTLLGGMCAGWAYKVAMVKGFLPWAA